MNMRMIGAGIVAAAWAVAPKAFASTGHAVALGDEQRVNQTTAGSQGMPAIAADADGDYVIVWEGNGPGDALGIFARVYDASGAPKTDEFLVNANTTSNQNQVDVAMSAGGLFVVSWTSFENGTDQNVFNRAYYADGTARSPATATANTYTTHDQNQSAVAMDANGNFVQVWHGEGTGDADGIFAQRFDAAGDKLGSAFLVNTTTTGTQETPDVAMDADGNFVVAWTGTDQEGTGNAGIYAQRFNSSGAAVGSEFHVNTFTTGTQSLPDVAMGATGEFVITWPSWDGGSGYEIHYRRYASNGTAAFSDEAVPQTASTQAYIASVGMNAAGEFAIAWQERTSGGDDNMRAALYDRLGNLVGSSVTVGQASAFQDFGDVALDGNGDFIVAFNSAVQDGDSYGIYARAYSGVENVDLGVALTDGTDPVAANGGMAYTATITNNHAALVATGMANRDAANAGIGTAAAFTATFTLPTGVTDVSTGGSSGWVCEGAPTLVCNYFNKLAPGASTQLIVGMKAPGAGGSATASVALSRGPYDATTSNDSDSETTTVDPPPPDSTPDAFVFTDQAGVEPGAVLTSNTVTVSGINQTVAISVTGGSYSIGCTATFTTSAGTIANGQTACVKQTASASFSTATHTVLTIGGVSDTFTGTTRAGSTTPAAFAFVDQAGLEPSTLVTSNTITLSGTEVPVPISVTGGEYSIGCTATFTAAAGSISPGASVCLRMTTSATASTTTSTTLTIGGVSDTWSLTTADPPAAGGGGALGTPLLLLLGLAGALRRRRGG